MSTFGPFPDLFPDVEHWRFVELALTNDDRAINRHAVELSAHRVDGGLIGRILLAATAQPGRGHRGPFRYANDLHAQNAFEQQFGLYADCVHGPPLAVERILAEDLSHAIRSDNRRNTPPGSVLFATLIGIAIHREH